MKKLPKGLKKHIRREKARIRREMGKTDIAKEKIKEIYQKNHYKDKISKT